MTNIIYLGALNKFTGKYVLPNEANKKDEYICPDCNKDLILCQGEINVHHFRHKVDSINPCHHYNKPTESQIHKDAKMLMKTLLENKTHIHFIRECASCKISAEINLPEITEGSIITLEHRFNYDDKLRVADVAHTLNGEIKGIYEICHTHKTCSEDRPEPWVEIDANSLLTLFNTNNTNESLIINCIRHEKCDKCLIYDLEETIQNNKYIFITKKISIDIRWFPNTTEITVLPNEENISLHNNIIINCKKNFNKDEKEIIDEFNINNIEDLIRSDKINKNDKRKCLECFKYVRVKTKIMGFEPDNGYNQIQLGKYVISIRILPNGIIKYCSSMGEQNLKKLVRFEFAQ
tara:strand:- start:141 stop:1187 length:1047 start_codon:yes stop_codon:yes gene_type:complete